MYYHLTTLDGRLLQPSEGEDTSHESVFKYWSARDLAPLLGYSQWRNFEQALNKAKIACEQVDQSVSDQFADVSKLIKLGKGGEREVQDYLLSRFACYLIAQNGDPRKPEVARVM